MTETLELTVPELDCADEARQIQEALGRLDGVVEVRTVVGARRALIAYESDRIAPGAIEQAINALGMTVTHSRAPVPRRRRSLLDLLGWGFVGVIALIALVGIVGERLGLVEAVVERIPPWLSLAAVVVGGYPIFRNVARALRNRTVTSHALMTLGIVGAVAIGQYAAGAVIVFFMRLADFIEGYTTERSRQAIKALLELAPETARIVRDGREQVISADQVGRGEIVIVKPGERIPVDGTVIEGRAVANQASITGESVPVEKQPGRSGIRRHDLRAGRPADSHGARWAGYDLRSDRPPRRAGGGGQGPGAAFRRPVHRVLHPRGSRPGDRNVPPDRQRHGRGGDGPGLLLVRDRHGDAHHGPCRGGSGRYTGDRDQGRPIPGGAGPGGHDRDGQDRDADDRPSRGDRCGRRRYRPGKRGPDACCSGGTAVGASARDWSGAHRGAAKPGTYEVTDFEAFPGEGITGLIEGERVSVGTWALMERAGIEKSVQLYERGERLAREGKSVAFVARGSRLIGAVALADTLRPEARPALDAMRALGVRQLLLLTGDRAEVARVVAGHLGLEFEAGVLPEGKIRAIERLQRQGRVVAMIGDGVNDAPALAQADVGIAMGAAGTDVAIEAAHVALMQDDLRAVPEAIRIARRAFRTIKQNLWFTAAYNVVGMVLAATGWLPPVAAAAAQSLPDVAVMLNAARLHGRA